MNLVVTGSRGFIGFNFLKQGVKRTGDLFADYDKIYLIDAGQLDSIVGYGIHNEDEYDDLVEHYSSLFVDVLGDINEQYHGVHGYVTPFDKEIGECDVINFASHSHVDDSINNPFELYTENANLVPNLIKGIGIDNIRNFFHIRTDEEFGSLDSDEPAFTKESKLNPRNPYSASKASQTMFLNSLRETFGLNVYEFMLANQYGPYQHHSKMIPATINRILDGEPALIYGEGQEEREWTFVEDTVNHMIDLMSQQSSTESLDELTFFGDPSGSMSNHELVKKIISEMGRGEIQFVGNRKGHDFSYRLAPNLRMNKTPFSEGLKKTIQHYERARD